MKNFIFFLLVMLGVMASRAQATSLTVGYSPRTGDTWLDLQLGDMNRYGESDRDYFIDDVVYAFGAPRYLISDLIHKQRWLPGDVYYACALAYQLRRPCADVVQVYGKNRGHGWGVVAQQMGIKPGSAAFFALKGNVGKANGRFKVKGHDHGGQNGQGKPGNSGQAGKDNGNGNGNGNGNKGKDKGDKH